MKKFFAVFAVLVALAVIVVACGGGGGGGGAPAATVSTPTAAKASTGAAMGAVTNGVGGITSGAMGLTGSITAGTGYAKRLAYVNKMQAKGANSANQQHLKVTAEVKKILAAPMVKKAVARARALKKATVNDTFPCSTSGSIDVTGTDNYDDAAATASIWNVTIKFNNCRDSDGSTYWEEMTGTMTDSGTSTYNANTATNGTDSETVTLTNVVFNSYASGFTGTPQYSDKLNATFVYDDDWSGTATTGTYTGKQTANGTFVLTMTYNTDTYTLTESFSNLSDTWTGSWNVGATNNTETWTDTLTGSASISGTYGGSTYSWSMSFSNLVNKMTSTYDANWNWQKDEVWVNGTFSFGITPAVTDCSNGSYTFVTANTTPLTWNSNSWSFCPDSGTVKINTVTVTFSGSGAGTIDYGSGQTTFTNCEIDTAAAVCGGMM